MFGDAHVEGEHDICSKLLVHIRIDVFFNNDHCESFTRFKRDEFRDLIENKLGLDVHVFAHKQGNNFYRFRREE